MTTVDVKFEKSVLDTIGRILLTDHDVQAAAEALHPLSARLDELVPTLAKHKVLTIAHTNLERLHDSRSAVGALAGRVLDIVRPAALEAASHRRLIEQQAADVGRALGTLGDRSSEVVVVKGLCNARFYPEPYKRWMRDLDVFVATWKTAIALLDVLLESGFEYDPHEHPWIKADLAKGRGDYGQIFLIKPVGTDFSRIDIHFGTYSAGFSGYLRSRLTDRSETVHVDNVAIPVLPPERVLLLAQAHALSDGYVAVKDVNDFVAVTSTRSVDLDEVARSLNEHELTPQAKLLTDHVRRLYDDERVHAAATELGRLLKGGSRSWRLHDRDWTLRARINADFTYRWHRSIGDGIMRSAVRSAQCFAFYARRLRLEVRPRTLRERLLHQFMPEPNLRDWQLRPDACTLLIDVTSLESPSQSRPRGAVEHRRRHSEEVEWLTVGGREVLRVRSRLYLPTLDLILEPAHVDAARSLLGAVE